MTLRIRVQPLAEVDLRDAREWYEAQDTGLGVEFVRAVRASLEHIQRVPRAFPRVGRVERQALVRRLP